MRRALLAAAIAIPAAALAAESASTGKVIEINDYSPTTGTSYVNAAHCAATDAVDLEWNIVSTGGIFTASGTYRIFASNTAPATSGTNANYCAETNDTTVSPNVYADQVDSAAVTASIQQKSVSGPAIATAANATCDSASEGKVVYVCSHWYDGSSNRVGYASGKFVIQVAAPNAPTNVSVGSNDASLDVSWTASASGAADADHYFAQATPSGGGTTVYSASTSGTSVTIGGLVNGTTYDVVVVAYSVGGNPSAESSPSVQGTPAPTADFWDTYKASGGVETGGCANGPAGGLALLGSAALLALRRRKP